MISMSNRIRTVVLNDRGQIVIPEEIRKDLQLKPGETLVLVQSDRQLMLEKESSVAKVLFEDEDEKAFWHKLALKGLESAWDECDEEWEKYYREAKA